MITLFSIRPKGFNIGNDAIFMGMQHFLYEAFGEVVNLISLPATSRYESQAKAGLTAKTIHEINQYGHGVIVGGGNLYENGELQVEVNALKALDVPMMLFSLSRGRIYDRNHRFVDRTDVMPDAIISAINQKANYSLARDEATYQYLYKLNCPRIEVGGCPTLFLDKLASRLPSLSQYKKTVFLSIRNPVLMNIPLKKQSQVTGDIKGIIDLLRRKNYQDIRLLCHDHRDIPYAVTFDLDYVYTDDIYNYLALLKSCSLNISYRLHSVLPCLSFGTPAVKISYDERAVSLMDTIGYSDWNPDMVVKDNIPGEIENRLDRIGELTKLRKQTREKWEGLYRTILGTYNKFAQDVRKNKERIG